MSDDLDLRVQISRRIALVNVGLNESHKWRIDVPYRVLSCGKNVQKFVAPARDKTYPKVSVKPFSRAVDRHPASGWRAHVANIYRTD